MEIRTAPRGKTERLTPDQLLLDPANPRLPEDIDARSQEDLLFALARDYSLLDLGRSIAENGYFEEEPLAAVPRADGSPLYVVVEGNRRLASLKLLTDKSMRDAIRRRLGNPMKEWDVLAGIAPDVNDIPVVLYGDRDDLLTFMGYRHITGVQQWDPLAKARFVSSLIEDYGMDFPEAARRIGSNSAHVREIYLAYRVYRQAKELGVDVSRVEDAYGVFTRSMSSRPLKTHIGITAALQGTTDPKDLATPVPENRLAELSELVSWVAGDSSTPAVISDSRQITDLGNVVGAHDALGHLRDTRDLAGAHDLTDGAAERVIKSLLQAQKRLESALRDIDTTTVTPGVEEAIRTVHSLASQLLEVLDQ